MIITINTKEDSKEEIKRAIQMLMRLVEHSEANEFNPVLPGSTDSGSGGAGIFGLFDSQSAAPADENGKKEPEEHVEIWEY